MKKRGLIKKLLSFFWQIDKIEEFFVNCIAALFTGVLIGIFLSLMYNPDLKRWINPFSLELFAIVIFIFATLVFAWIFYGCGILILKYLKAQERIFAFRNNFLAGIYGGIWASLLVIYHLSIINMIIISIVAIILFIPLTYLITKIPRKINKIK